MITNNFPGDLFEEEEYCLECGTALSRHERFLCYDCQQDEWYNEEQARYEDWWWYEDDENY